MILEADKRNIKSQRFGAKGGNSAAYGPQTREMPGSSSLRPKAPVATYVGIYYVSRILPCPLGL